MRGIRCPWQPPKGAGERFVSGILVLIGGAPGVINSSIPGASGSGIAGIVLLNDGTYTSSGSAGGNWVTPATTAIAALYQAKTDVTAGTFSNDPSAGSWLDLSSTRLWDKQVAGTVTFTLSIREKATGIVRLVQAGQSIEVT